MKKSLMLAAAAAMAATPGSASAAELVLGLAIDSSGSIGRSNFELQRQAYVNVLSDSTVLPTDGSVAIVVYQFASGVQTIFSLSEITNANIGNLIAAINGMVYRGGGTSMSSVINRAAADMAGTPFGSSRQLLDISTDGRPNSQTATNAARANALAVGIDQINCVGIGSGARCENVIAGSGAFFVNATGFDQFEQSLRTKVRREVTGGAVPEPSTWLMLLLGFFGIGASLRHSKTGVKRAKVNKVSYG